MARVPKSASKLAFPLKKQSVWGTRLINASLTKFITLQQPLIPKPNLEFWTDTGEVGKGHNWETGRGLLARHVECEIPVQPLPDFAMGVLIGLFFSNTTPAASTGAEGYTHTSSFTAPETLDAALFTSLAFAEDVTDFALEDMAVSEITIRGDGNKRLEMGAKLIATKIEELSAYTWPDAATLYYLHNYSGAFEIASASKLTQLRGFELTMRNGISAELAFQKAATEAARQYPSSWPFTPQREVSLTLDIEAEQGDLTLFRAAQEAFTEQEYVISCLGAMLSSVEPRSLLITMPKGVIDDIEQDFGSGDRLRLKLKIAPHYDDTLEGPIELAITTLDAAYLTAEA